MARYTFNAENVLVRLFQALLGLLLILTMVIVLGTTVFFVAWAVESIKNPTSCVGSRTSNLFSR